jgi:heat shock protein HslJ
MSMRLCSNPSKENEMNRYLVLAPILALAACTRPPQGQPATTPAAEKPAATAPATPVDAPALSANHWRLTDAKNAQGQRIDALFAKADKPVQLDFANGRVAVGNTCNRMGGAYSVRDDELRLDRMASTMMACADARLMALDQEVGNRLQGSLEFAQSADTLTLTTASGDVLVFTGEPTTETRYGGPGETVFLEVAAQARACSDPLVAGKQCLQVRELKYDDKGIKTGADGAFGNFYNDIQGYTHEPGTRNVLRVKRYTIKDPPADGSSLAYVLDMVVESEVVKP